MLIKFNQDIQTRKPVYIICNNDGVAKIETTDICLVIRQIRQTK